MLNFIQKSKFKRSFIGTITIYGAILGLTLLLKLIGVLFPPLGFVVPLLSFGLGSIYLIIAGCIGPGRYRKEFDLLLYEPEDGSSFSTKVPLSGFVIDENISSANVMVNGKVVKKVEFDENGFIDTEIERKNVTEQALNKIWLQYYDIKSNVNSFTFFEYEEDMSPEEMDELIEIDESRPIKSLQAAKESYLKSISSGAGLIALGIGTSSLLIFATGILFDIILNT